MTVAPLKLVSDGVPSEAASLVATARPLLQLSGISKTFANGVTAIAGVDLTIRPGEFVSLLGPSGCGKSTMLKLIAGLAAPSLGTIDWPQSTYDALGTPEPALGFVFQEPTLLPWRTSPTTSICRSCWPAPVDATPRSASRLFSNWWACRRSPIPIRANYPAA
jgi:ABC-type nitrate/sulfonate/bicarbonate transport system, ATPase component